MAQALGRLKEANLSLSNLKQDYGSLRVKYEDLVKPARSSEGRHVVEVQYSKEGGEPRIRFRESRSGPFRTLTHEELEQRLERLKAEHPEGLYVRMIFPEDSGLSYDEAFGLTGELHRKFDYYYQERSPAETPASEPPSGAQTPSPD